MGTSTATILAHAIFADGVSYVTAGASAIDIKRGFDRALKAAVGALKAQSKPVVSRKEQVQVATISAHIDESIGEIVAEAMEKVGGEGVITVEGSNTTGTTLDIVEGMRFDRGYMSPYFCDGYGKDRGRFGGRVHFAYRSQDQHHEGLDLPCSRK